MICLLACHFWEFAPIWKEFVEIIREKYKMKRSCFILIFMDQSVLLLKKNDVFQLNLCKYFAKRDHRKWKCSVYCLFLICCFCCVCCVAVLASFLRLFLRRKLKLILSQYLENSSYGRILHEKWEYYIGNQCQMETWKPRALELFKYWCFLLSPQHLSLVQQTPTSKQKHSSMKCHILQMGDFE